MPPGSFPPPLYVDLDGALLRTDSLFESVVRLARTAPAALFQLPIWMAGGCLHLKLEVARRVELDPRTLPYNPAVLRLIERAGEAGRRVVLISASPQSVVDCIARHLGVFDEALGSSTENLKGARKLERIRRREGGGAFDYVGNSRADQEVWKASRRGFTTSRICAAGVRKLGRRPGISDFLEACRPHQWAKNLLVLLPLALSHSYTIPRSVGQALVAFLAFSLVASAVYLANDLWDLGADRQHHQKRCRPLASGRLPLTWGALGAVCLVVLGVGLGFALNVLTGVLVAGYVLANVLYSGWGKSSLVVDVVLLATFYAWRILAGAAAIEVVVSPWLVMFSLFFFLGLALLKRVVGLQKPSDCPGTRSGRSYIPEDGDVLTAAGIACSCVSAAILALYIHSDKVGELYQLSAPLWLIPALVLYWTIRVWLLAVRGEVNSDPVLFALHDAATRVVGVLALLAFLLGTYGLPLVR